MSRLRNPNSRVLIPLEIAHHSEMKSPTIPI
jgi:hypothetical protein